MTMTMATATKWIFNYPKGGPGRCHVILFLNYRTLSLTLERVKVDTLNLIGYTG